MCNFPLKQNHFKKNFSLLLLFSSYLCLLKNTITLLDFIRAVDDLFWQKLFLILSTLFLHKIPHINLQKTQNYSETASPICAVILLIFYHIFVIIQNRPSDIMLQKNTFYIFSLQGYSVAHSKRVNKPHIFKLNLYLYYSHVNLL